MFCLSRLNYETGVFIFTLIVYIGWGHISPVTIGSKVFTAFVAIFGIPLFFMMIISGAQIVIRITKDVLRKCLRQHNVQTLYKPVIGVMLLLYIFIGAEVIAKMEGFEYREALWYSVMSLTTVGFGDVVQTGENLMVIHGNEAKHLSVAIFLLFWLVGGFMLIGALLLSFVYDNWGDKKTAQFHHIFKRGDDKLVENMEYEAEEGNQY